ncbi:MAG: ARPP-1 family domain-containing protein [Gammaproteobacteria bacterium]
MHILDRCLDGLKYGRPQTHLNLTAYPLLVADSPEPGYVTLAAAKAAGQVSVHEVSDDGVVRFLLLENTGPNPILVLDGEELVGAKQNRAANCTILAPAHETTRIPVSCVEAGRWHYDSDESCEFDVSPDAMFMDGRRAKMESVTASLRERGYHASDQDDVWARIDEKAARMNSHSETDAMADIYAQNRRTLQTYVDAFAVADGQVGAVFAIGRRVEGLELFDADRTFAELAPKILRSYAIDAMERPLAGVEPDPVAAPIFVIRVAHARSEIYPAVGLGTDLRLRGHGVIAAGLIFDQQIVHLAAFAAPGEEQHTDGAGNGDVTDRLRSFLSRQRFRKAA